jgi:hypothetical protein
MSSVIQKWLGVAHAVTINPNIPGSNSVTPGLGGPGALVANFYQFALLIGGILAFGAIVYGGVKYTFAAGNPSGQSEGKAWVTSALWGLLLLASAYIVLNTINPELLNLTLPGLPGISAPIAGAPVGTTGGNVTSDGRVLCGGRTSGQCLGPAAQACVNGGDSLNPNYSCKSTNSASNTCGGDPPKSHWGDCAPLPSGTKRCCSNSGGNTLATVRYSCGSC